MTHLSSRPAARADTAARPRGDRATARDHRAPSPATALAKVPQITAMFWLIKILTTGLGESASDWMAQKTLWIPAAIGFGALVVALTRQFRAKAYHAPTYWFAVAMVAVFGTVAADVFRIGLSVPLPYTVVGYATALTLSFAAWWRSERNLSIHDITTPRREAFYWTTVLLTFALGTAAGDLTAFTLNLGFGESIALFGGAILVPALLYRFANLNAIVASWSAYVLTRPLGASVADWLGKGKPLGLGVGDGTVTAIATALVIGLVALLARAGRAQRGSAA